MAENNILMRSLMFVPAHNNKFIESSLKRDADILLLDIEDSVPKQSKQIARDNILELVKMGGADSKLIFPRINDRESGELLKDITQLTVPGISGFMYPKANNEEDIYFIGKLLETIEYEKKFPIGTFKLIPLIETTGAVMNITNICKISDRVIAVAFGHGDFVRDLNGKLDSHRKSINTARNLIAIGARSAGVNPIDTVQIDVHDFEKLEQQLIEGSEFGFEGMLVLSPNQLPLVNKYYSPTQEEIEWAKDILRLNNEAEIEGNGVAVKNGHFIGPPLVKMAQKILDKNNLIISKKQEI